MIKIVLTIELISFLMFCFALFRDRSKWENVHTTDGGWTTKYTISLKDRQITRSLIMGSIFLAVSGILILIWNY